jgi:YegS/Rv2252/BmrU family lipid kinase
MLEIIINPASKSGKGIRIWNKVEALLNQKKIAYSAHFTKCKEDASILATHLTSHLKSHLTLVVLGGDGTLNDVIQGLQNPEMVLIGYIPTGSSNDFARSLGVQKKMKDNLEHIISSSQTKSFDVGLCEANGVSRKFLVSSGLGFDAAVCVKVNKSKIKNMLNHIGLGKLSYLSIALLEIAFAKKGHVTITLDDTDAIHLDHCLFMAAMNQKYEGGGFLFCPDANPHDSLLDIIAVSDISTPKALSILPTAFFGKHTNFQGIHIYQAAKIKVESEFPLYFHTDGEAENTTTQLNFSTLSYQLRFLY